MAYITLLSSVLSFFLIAISADTQDIMVDKYDIDIRISPFEFDITLDIVFKNLRTREEINMYTDNVGWNTIVSVIKKDTDVNLGVKHNIVINSTSKNVIYFLKDKMDPGLYIMKMIRSITFDSAFNQVYSDEKEVVWLSLTHFQPIEIQKLIPCWVKPKEDTSGIFSLDMPTFNLSVLHFAHYSILTNMPVREERLDEAKPIMKRTYFDITPRMSPYQLSIVMTNFTRIIIDEDDVVSMWCRNRSASSLQFALTIARNITTYLHSRRKVLRCRFSTRVKLIVIPKIQSSSTSSRGSFPERNDSLVHPGIIIANENDITYNEELDTVGRKYNMIRLLGYEIMREYYEWIVNPYWEPSTWLSKGFAMFIAMHNLDQIWPDMRMKDLFVVQIQHECLDFDVDNSKLPSHQQYKTIPVEIIDNMRASVMWRMLQHEFSSESEKFWEVIDAFTYDSVLRKKKRHLKFFWRTLRDAHDEMGLTKYDLEGLMHPWVKERGYPVLTVKRNYDTSKNTIELSVEDINFRKKNQLIPVSYTTRTKLNLTQTPVSWLNLFDKNFVFTPPYRDKDSWVIFNVQQAGYYRVNYDDENWTRISKYLNGEDYWKIHVLNRAQLIDDAFQFMLLGKLKADIFWQLTKYLERERDYIAWYPMFKAIEYMSTSFHFYKEFFSLIGPKLTTMLNMLLVDLKYEEQPTDDDFTKILRQEAAQWACFLKLHYCIELSNSLLKEHLKTHTNLLPWWRKWTYCYGLIKADDITWHQTLNKIKGNDNDKILYLATCSNYLVNINHFTSYTNDDVNSFITSSTIVQLELRHFVYTIVESVKDDVEYNDKNDDKTYKVNNIFIDLLDNIKIPRQLKLSTAVLILFNNIYSFKHLLKARDAFILKGTSESDLKIYKIWEARQKQLMNHYRLFTRIKPRN